MIGTTVGSYSLQRELGRGGMGAVYVGTHALLGRTAAVKVLLPEWSKNQDMVQRFFNEARAATAIKHPGIVEIYDFGFAQDGSAFIVMEFLEGEPLSSRLKRHGKVAPAFAVAVTRQIATALAVAHKAGIVHRDLKPDNVFLVPDAEIGIGERVKLLDFGIAKLGEASGGGLQKTSTGAIMGTPYYMSPEQCRGAGHVDARSDLYAIGVMLYEMLCGRVPFVAEGAGDIIAAHLLLPPTPLRVVAPEVPVDVEALVMRLLSKQPHDRPQTAEALAQELAALGQALGLASSMPPIAPPTAPTIAAPSTPPTSPTPAPSSEAKLQTIAQPALARQPQRSTTLGGASGQELAAAPARGRTGMILGIVVVVAAAAGVVVFVTTQGSKPAATVSDGTGTPPGMQPPPPGEDVHLIAARTAIETQMWTEAIIESDAALKTDPENEEAKELAALARRESAAQVASNAMGEAILAGDLVTANARFAAIPDDSTYKAPAMRDLIAARENHVVDKTPDVRALIAAGKCKDAKAMVAALETAAGAGPVEPLAKAAAKCKPAKAGDKPDPPPEPAGAMTDEQLMDQGKTLLIDGKVDAALAVFDQLIERDPTNQKARFNAGVAAAQKNDCKAALQYIVGIDTPKAARLRKQCLATLRTMGSSD